MKANLPSAAPSSEKNPVDAPFVAGQLRKSTVFLEYQKAFETTTGLPLTLRQAGAFQSPLHDSGRLNPFCALMATSNKSCAACLCLQQEVEEKASDQATTLQCFAGLNESAVPIKLGSSIVGYLQTGQVFFSPATPAQFEHTRTQLTNWQSPEDIQKIEKAYFQTRVVPRETYDSVLRLLSIFSLHLSSLSNQVVVQETVTEMPAIVRAKAYIAEHLSEELSLESVAQAVHMSAFYFCKLFKKATGVTFTDYLARVRTEKVKRLLENPHTRISEAAFEAGFQSLSQFNRVFRRITGKSPSDFREELHSHV